MQHGTKSGVKMGELCNFMYVHISHISRLTREFATLPFAKLLYGPIFGLAVSKWAWVRRSVVGIQLETHFTYGTTIRIAFSHDNFPIKFAILITMR